MSTFRAALRQHLRSLRGSAIGWIAGLVGYSGLTLTSWRIISSQGEDIQKFVAKYPPEMAAFFGDMTKILEPSGYLHMYLFSLLPVIFGIFWVSASTALVVADEEAGRMDLLLAYPVSRSTIFFARLTAVLLVTLVAFGASWLTLVLGASSVSFDVPALDLWKPFAATFALGAVFVGFGVTASLVLPSRKAALMASGALLVASYVLPPLGQINPDLVPLARLVPGYWYQGGEALDDLHVLPLFAFVGIATALVAGAHWLFLRRDVRVGGEGSTWLPRRKRATSVE